MDQAKLFLYAAIVMALAGVVNLITGSTIVGVLLLCAAVLMLYANRSGTRRL